MSVVLPNLPFDLSALEPYISQRTLEFHHGKHHKAYVDNLNNLIEGSLLDKASLEEIVHNVANQEEKAGIFNNAAQVWNHTFYWDSIAPGGGGEPRGEIKTLVERDFGSFDAFQKLFKQAATSQFGSGWVWLVLDQDKLRITKTSNADLPLIHKQKPLLNCDVWEHAYYLDYQNRRLDYADIFLQHLVNWQFAENNLHVS